MIKMIICVTRCSRVPRNLTFSPGAEHSDSTCNDLGNSDSDLHPLTFDWSVDGKDSYQSGQWDPLLSYNSLASSEAW